MLEKKHTNNSIEVGVSYSLQIQWTMIYKFRGRRLLGSVYLHLSAPRYVSICQMSSVPVLEERRAGGGGHWGTQMTLPPQYGGDSCWNVLLFKFSASQPCSSRWPAENNISRVFLASRPRWEDLKSPVMLRGIAVRWRESFPRPCRGVNATEFTLRNKYKQGKNGTMFLGFFSTFEQK